MRIFLRTSTIILALGLAMSCSEQEFSSVPTVPNNPCADINNNYGDEACIEDEITGFNVFNYEVDSCKADILFVVDNSGSMYDDQTELAMRFPNFLNSISSLDYQIAITTTDVSSSPNNYDPNNPQLLARQDGRLIKFPDGNKFITKSTPSAQGLFEQTVKREETKNCDNRTAACPSSDERGIYAVNYALNTAQARGNLGPQLFFRPDSHLALVFLSDENVRSDLGRITPYIPTDEDKPQTLIRSVEKIFGTTKTFSVHPIVIQSKLTYANSNGQLLNVDDVTCHREQLNQSNTSLTSMIRYGTWYEQLSLGKLGAEDGSVINYLGGLVPGHAGSICAGNFTPIVSKIGQSIVKHSQVVSLACEPTDLVVTIGVSRVDGNHYSIDGNRLQLPSTCERVKVTYKCSQTK